MDKEIFLNKKNKLSKEVNYQIENCDLNDFQLLSLKKVLDIIDKQYDFENRLKIKGYLTRIIIDSLDIDYNLGEKLIEFDNHIN